MDKISIIGYSGHSYVILDSIIQNKLVVEGYFELEEREKNPFCLPYLGQESKEKIDRTKLYFLAIGDNNLRRKISNELVVNEVTIVDQSANVSESAQIGDGTYVGKNVCINSQATVGKGVILNTACIIEHECVIGDYCHIAPGTVLCGNVRIGSGTLIGANSTILPGITIGDNVIIGSGSVVVKDIKNNTVNFGNPSKKRC